MGNRSVSWVSPPGSCSVPGVTALYKAFITSKLLPPYAKTERNIVQVESATGLYGKVWRFNMELHFPFI